MKRVLLAITVGLTVFGMVFGLAAGLDVGATQLGSGGSDVASCDQDGVAVSFGLEAGNVANVAEVTVAGIDAACADQALSVELLAGTTVLAGTTELVQTGGGDQVITISAPASEITGVNVTITG